MASLMSEQKKPANGLRLTGFARFTELLGRDLKGFLLMNLLTLLGFLPFFIGLTFALLSASLLVLLPVCLLGGLLAGPSLSAMLDGIYRSLRDAPGRAFANYRKAWKQNAAASLLPGSLLCLLMGADAFMVLLFTESTLFPSLGNIALLLVGLLLLLMLFTAFWPQIVLFEETIGDRIRNTILFIARYLWRVLGVALLQLLYWGVLLLFLPWSLVLFPILGFWFILFLTHFLLYGAVNEAFSLEERIAEAFPEQMPYYETDAMWVERKRSER